MTDSQVEVLVPVVLPDVPSAAVTADKVLLALSQPELPCEGADGWIAVQLRDQVRGATSISEDVRKLQRFVGWLDISLERFGIETERPRMTVSWKYTHI